jgi:hypothetical protein
MVDKLNPKTKRIIKAKIQGKKHKEIAAVEYPNATEQSGVELVSRQLRNNASYLEQSKMIALKEHNITWSRVIKPIDDALEAGKKWTETDDKTGKITHHELIDHNTRLRASKQAVELLQVKGESPETESLLSKLPDVDEIQLVRLLKK